MLDLSCRDWRDRLRAGESLIPRLELNAERGGRAVAIFNRLRLPDVPGQPHMAEAAGNWFREIVATLFGSIDDSGVRWIRELFLLVPKKNSKTTNGGGLMLTALLLNERPRAEFLLIGPTQDIARLAFAQVLGMIEADTSGTLQKRMHIREHQREVIDRRTKATLKIKSFDSSVVTGVKPAGVLIDELHEIGRSPDAGRVIGQLRGGLMPNPEAFLLFITTQSDQPPVGAFRDELKKARAIRDGLTRGVMLPVLYEFPRDIQKPGTGGEDPPWYNSALWWMVTPNRDKSVTIGRLEEEFETAKLVGLQEVTRWASQHLNIEIGIGLRTDRWRGADHWKAATEPGLTLAVILAQSEVIVAGIDGGGLDDLLALAILGRLPAEDGADDVQTVDQQGAQTIDQDGNPQNALTRRRWALWVKCWADRGVLELRKSESSRLRDLETAGDLVFVDDLEIAYADLADIVAEADETGLLAKVGLDPMGVGAIVDALAERGIEGDDRVVGISQGWHLTGPIKTTETKVKNRTLIHCGQPIMDWAVGNAKTEPRGNAVMITKAVSGTGKIDPLMAALDAVQLMSRNPEAQGGPSLYDLLAKSAEVAEDDMSGVDEASILRDPRHPMFEVMRRRFEDRLAMQDDD